ncbi:hypothetical protein [Streptomyces sp. KR80]|uniref:hypothetical protein n=1 Tax=Streptomyces sp. KR80 TaxID=3457426 RepID=UPI003FD1E504
MLNPKKIAAAAGILVSFTVVSTGAAEAHGAISGPCSKNAAGIRCTYQGQGQYTVKAGEHVKIRQTADCGNGHGNNGGEEGDYQSEIVARGLGGAIMPNIQHGQGNAEEGVMSCSVIAFGRSAG